MGQLMNKLYIFKAELINYLRKKGLKSKFIIPLPSVKVIKKFLS